VTARLDTRSLSLVGFLALVVAACSSGSDGSKTDTGGPNGPACTVPIQRFKELTIVDEAIATDARASNAADGAWSFRHLLENMAPPGANMSDFTMKWLQDWATRRDLNNVPLDKEPRTDAMQSLIICPWLRRTPANNCDATCGTCSSHVLDLGQAPFRLLGIVNRMDLREKPDATGPSGEGRLAFGFTSGAGDDPASAPGPMSIIFEYRLPDALTTRQWADKWHALGAHAAFDEAYKAELQQVTDAFTARNASPERVNGNAISQVRTNESLLNWIWQLREFTLDPAGNLLLTTVKDTPAEPFNGTPGLVDLIRQNKDAVLADKFVVPAYMLGGSIDQFIFRWNLPGLDEETRNAFSRTTCNGCHGETATTDTAFHLSPFRRGIEKVSPFLNDPKNQAADELSKREAAASRILCTN
jgi:hypothetical protein